MAEWSKAAASKAVILGNWNRGFESHSLRQSSLLRSFAWRSHFFNGFLNKLILLAK